MEDVRFGGIGRLYGREGLERLARARVCVIGLGGVGSWTVEALARSGLGALTLVDLDDVCVSNTNRQIHALEGEVGRPKAVALAERARRINPACDARAVVDFFTEETADAILDGPHDYVVDAIDHVPHKSYLVARCQAAGLPLVVTGGAGGRRDPTRVAIDDLTRAYNDALLSRVRKTLRRERGFPRDRSTWGIPCVFSAERAAVPLAEDQGCAGADTRTPLRLDCASGYGTASFVTGVFGLAAASVVVSWLAGSGEVRGP